MDKNTPLTPQQSLDLISEVISQTRDNIRAHSFLFLLWGWALAAASILRFFLQTQTSFKFYFLPFPVLAGTALLTSIFYQRSKVSETHLNYFIRKLWTVLSLGFIAAVFVSLSQGVEPFAFTLILAATGTSISGLVLKFRPLLIGSVCFLAASVACVFVPGEYKVLIHGLAIIAGYLIPGYMLRNTSR